ncbi:MAG: FMN-binding protein, partial [Pseudohongiellaceae bacterium]
MSHKSLSALIVAAFFTLCTQHVLAQTPERADIRTPWTTELEPEWLRQVMPAAETFGDKSGEPPVFRAYRAAAGGGGEQELVGFVFLSADVPPGEKGYSAPIDMLIGMDLQGQLTGLKVLNYTESFRYSRGDFAADAEFQGQFPGKSIADEFRIARDVDGLSGATMTSFGIARGARNAARRVASAYLEYEEGDAQQNAWFANARERLELLSWQDMLDQGIVKQLTIPLLTGEELQFTVTYIGRKVLGEFFIGPEDYARAERDSSIRLGGTEMVLVAIGGSGATNFRMNLISFQQGDAPARRVQPQRFVTAGNADVGAIAGRANYAGAIVMEEGFDPTLPFSILYKPQASLETYSLEYSLGGIGLALAKNEPILSLEEIERARIAELG